MGNRAILTFKINDRLPSIYLHWNGGRASIEGFLKVAKHYQLKVDGNGIARLVQIIGNFFGGKLSIGIIPTCKRNECGDNGLYIINEDWEIEKRKTYNPEEINPDKTEEIFQDCLEKNNQFFLDENGQISKI